MYIREIFDINNYRNYSGISIKFSKINNYIVGENNIGKTNLIELIYSILEKNKFQKEDFNEIDKPIDLKILIKYDEEEIGFFSDYFDPNETNTITIRCIQEDYDGRIDYYCNEDVLPSSLVKKLNVLYYHSQRTPSKEISFSKNQGTGRILKYFVDKSFQKKSYETVDMLNIDKINDVTNIVNEFVSVINQVMSDDLRAFVPETESDIISKLLDIGDSNNVKISDLGDGIQYAFNIILNILDKILEAKINKGEEKFKQGLVDSNGMLLFPLFVLLDEPEVHQHPHRQRKIIKKICEIIDNKNESMNNLLKELFDIDGIIGQLFVVTHSPNILSDNYKEYIRVYRDLNGLGVVSGENVSVTVDIVKHMQRMNLALKESFFSKKVLLVEGDSEKGAIPAFAAKLGIDFDDYSTSLVKLDGAESVTNVMKIYEDFKIQSYALLDKDKEADYSDTPNIYFTQSKDFEYELHDKLDLHGILQVVQLMGALPSIYGEVVNEIGTAEFLIFKDNPTSYKFSSESEANIIARYKTIFLSKLKNNKNQVVAYSLALNSMIIPESYKRFIELVK